ncbi:hypothetical protein DFI_18700 (plasmid) [Deinococcus ficus]|uniref:Uncharacterized protein n=1 Tax=Deinococcus ficus TaxID=317577 RepID=A0A221T2U4_9DEIO|nr:hypothetical protein DFI_18700 [Deinococcus ficus]
MSAGRAGTGSEAGPSGAVAGASDLLLFSWLETVAYLLAVSLMYAQLTNVVPAGVPLLEATLSVNALLVLRFMRNAWSARSRP